MKKLFILLALVTIGLFTASAQTKSKLSQKLEVFTQLDKVTETNHASLLPKSYTLYKKDLADDGVFYTYQSPLDEFISFKFDEKGLIKIVVLNPKLAGNIHKYGYTDYIVNGKRIKAYIHGDEIIQEGKTVAGDTKWEIFSKKWVESNADATFYGK